MALKERWVPPDHLANKVHRVRLAHLAFLALQENRVVPAFLGFRAYPAFPVRLVLREIQSCRRCRVQ